jgi:hypothetical protein
MSSTVILWVVLVLAAAAAGAFAWVIRYRPRQRSDPGRERLRGSTTQQILGDVRAVLDGRGWERFSAVGRIRALAASSSDADVLSELNALWQEACAEDEAKARSGRDSNETALYDSGLVQIMEALEERVVRTKTL